MEKLKTNIETKLDINQGVALGMFEDLVIIYAGMPSRETFSFVAKNKRTSYSSDPSGYTQPYQLFFPATKGNISIHTQYSTPCNPGSNHEIFVVCVNSEHIIIKSS